MRMLMDVDEKVSKKIKKKKVEEEKKKKKKVYTYT